MKSKTVDTVTSNEELVRLRIFDGVIPLEEAGRELLELERAQHAATRAKMADLLSGAWRGRSVSPISHDAVEAAAEAGWTAQIYEQLIGRVDRPGQTADEITALYFISDSGSDPVVMSVNGLKKSQASGIVDPLKGVAEIYSNESRIKLLAQSYLAKRGGGT